MGYIKEHHVAYIMYYFSLLCGVVLPDGSLRALLGSSSGNISLVVSNVRGGSEPLVFRGKVAKDFYGLVPPPPGVGVGCLILSYTDKLVFTVNADSAVGVDPVEMVDHISNAVHLLMEAPKAEDLE